MPEDKIGKLYSTLKNNGYYTKSKDEFISKWKDSDYQAKVYTIVKRDGLYTKSEEEFQSTYNPVKKKDATESSGGIASLVTQEDNEQTSIPFKNTEDSRSEWTKPKKDINWAFEGVEPKEEPGTEQKSPDTKESFNREVVGITPEGTPMASAMAELDGVMNEKLELWKANELRSNPMAQEEVLDKMLADPEYRTETLHKIYASKEEKGFSLAKKEAAHSLVEMGGDPNFVYSITEEVRDDMIGRYLPDVSTRGWSFLDSDKSEIEDEQYFWTERTDRERVAIDYPLHPEVGIGAMLSENSEFFTDFISKRYQDLKYIGEGVEKRELDLNDKIKDFEVNPTPEKKNYIENEYKDILDNKHMYLHALGELKNLKHDYIISYAKYLESEGKKGGTGGMIFKELADGFMTIPRTISQEGVQILPWIKPEAYALKEEDVKEAKEKGIPIQRLLANQTKRFVINEMLPKAKDLWSFGTTDEWEESEDRNDIQRVTGFVMKSLGTASSLGGGKLASLSFMAQSYEGIQKEMASEEFDEFSLFEKNLIAVPYAMAIGQLEKIGFVASTGGGRVVNDIVRKLTARAFTDLPKNASKSMIKRKISESVLAMSAEGGFKILAGGGIEGVTELSQVGAEVTWKNIINSMADHDYFDVPDLSTVEGRVETLGMMKEDGYYGMLSGFMMGGPSVSYKIISNGFHERSGDKDFENFKNLITNEKIRNLSIETLKESVKKGEITAEEAKLQLDAMDRSVSIITSIPEDLSLRDQKKSFGLIKEKQDLEGKVVGKDKSLSEKENVRINEINEELKAISTGKVEVKEEIKTGQVTDQEKEVPAGSKLFSDKNEETKAIADKYKKEKGITTPEGEAFSEIDTEKAKKISDAYDAMVDNPNDPEVKAAYEAMATETMDQHKAIDEAGYKFELWEGEGEPYANSGEMIADVRDNKHMYVFSTEQGFGDKAITDQERADNPLLKDSGIKDINGKPLLVNDVFRGVHDFFGHTERGNSFGAKGEENAWDVHARMYSDKARRAMTTETRGQNSFVNFSGVNDAVQAKFKEANALDKAGKTEEASKLRKEAQGEMSFAKQKIGLMPEEFSDVEEKYNKKEDKKEVKESKTETKESFESKLSKGADKANEMIDATIKKLDDFGKGTLGMNVPVVVAKKALQAAKLAITAGKSLTEVIASAISSVKESKWYKELSKADQKKAEAFTQKLLTDPDSTLKGKTPKPNTAKQKEVNKDTGVTKKKTKVTVNEETALKDQLKLEGRAAKGASKYEKDNRKAIYKYLKDKFKGFNGSLSGRRVGAILNKALSMNLSDPVMAQRFKDYVEKVVNDAKKVDKIKNAYKLKDRIKKLAKIKGLQITMKNMALKFAKIDPTLVEDIDAYLEMAETVKKLITKSKVKTTGKGADKIKEAVWADREGKVEVDAYTKDQLKKTEEIEKNLLISAYPQLEEEGKIKTSMTLKQVTQAVNEYKENEKRLLESEVDNDLMKDLIESVVLEYEIARESFIAAIETGVDPVTGDVLTDGQRAALIMLSEADVKDIKSIKEIMAIRDIMTNFSVNGVTDMIASKARYIKGRQGSRKIKESTKDGRTINKKNIVGWTKKGKVWYNGLLAQMDQFLRGIFKDTDMVLLLKKESGFSDVENGASKGRNISRKEKKKIHDKYRKKKPNGRDFYDKYNVFQSSVYANLIRNSGGTEAEIEADFNRRLDVIIDTYEYLSSTGEYEGEARTTEEEIEGEILGEVLSDLGIEKGTDFTLSDLESKVDSINKSAVNDTIEMWGKDFDKLSDTMSLMYNSELDRDVNYTHDSWSRKDGFDSSTEKLTESLEGGAMAGLKDGHLSTQKSGAMMDTKKPSKTSPTMRLNFDFYKVQFRAHEAAMIDIHTAGGIMQMKGFFESKSSREILTKDEINAIKGRMFSFVAMERGGVFEEQLESKRWAKFLNFLAGYSTALALGGFKGFILQPIPAYASVVVMAPIASMGMIRRYIFNAKSIKKWIDNEGIDLSLRGIESQADVYMNDSNMKKRSILNRISKMPNKAAELQLKPLVIGDRGITRATFVTYYKDFLLKNGMSISEANAKIKKDMKDGVMDKDAMEYAKHMTNSFANASNAKLMGKMFTKGGSTGLLRKVFLPYATFSLNQKTRTFNDFSIIASAGVTAKERRRAIQGVGATVVEMTVYQSLRISYSIGMYLITSSLLGWDDAEDDPVVTDLVDKENKKRRINGDKPLSDESVPTESEFRSQAWSDIEIKKASRGVLSSVVSEMISPIPMSDNYVKEFFNEYALTPLQRGMFKKELDKAIKQENKKVFIDSKGTQKEMSAIELEEFIYDWEQEEFLHLYSSDMPDRGNFGVLSIGLDKIAELGKWKEAAENGRVETTYRGTTSIKYLTKEDQEKVAAMRYGNTATTALVIPADIGGYTSRKGWKIIQKSALTGTQLAKHESLTEFFIENDFKGITDTEKKIIKNKNSSISEILKDTRGVGSEEWVKWITDEAVRKMKGKTDKEYLDWKLNDILTSRGL